MILLHSRKQVLSSSSKVFPAYFVITHFILKEKKKKAISTKSIEES